MSEVKPTGLSENLLGMLASSRESRNSMYYTAAWTDSGFLLGCSHEHETVVDADSCIPCAGGYVVAVEDGVMRSLTPKEEEAEFQRVHYAPRTDTPAPDTTVQVSAEKASSDPRYAVMTPIWVVDHWTWTTWMCFDTYAQAVAHAREGNEVVRFASDKGDEFLCRGNHIKELLAKLERARAILRARTIVVERAAGSTLSVTGADFSYGVGKDIDEAEFGLKRHKAEREDRGEIARGELRGIIMKAETFTSRTEQSPAINSATCREAPPATN